MSDEISKSVQDMIKRNRESGMKLEEVGRKYNDSNGNFVDPNSSNYIPESNQDTPIFQKDIIDEKKKNKKEYDKGFVSMKLKKEIAEKLDHVINFNTSSTHITLKRGEMISKIIDFYIFTVIRNAGSEDKAKKNLISANEAEKFYNFIREMAENQDDSEF
ncbi:hypothetical protein RZ70_14380 (plasmid) [Apilactobacillus kunkeei]|uniref:hypothetical protein n=1 Tax=Apilactobacillus kunkeei TaxID=148814 RepID=UPI0006BFE42C|nr:hypothetical protein [Apilactobacillus kunkeei]KOY72813.1 hypothetical protein RZ70_14380 [Apilactobacillus kunkeei]